MNTYLKARDAIIAETDTEVIAAFIRGNQKTNGLLRADYIGNLPALYVEASRTLYTAELLSTKLNTGEFVVTQSAANLLMLNCKRQLIRLLNQMGAVIWKSETGVAKTVPTFYIRKAAADVWAMQNTRMAVDVACKSCGDVVKVRKRFPCSREDLVTLFMYLTNPKIQVIIESFGKKDKLTKHMRLLYVEAMMMRDVILEEKHRRSI